MMRSMFAGVSGLRSHQLMLDVVSNNIANVNTTGFKASRVLFADTLSQTMRDGASGGAFEEVSINPLQVGLGVAVKSTSATFTSGSLQLTDRPLDTAISGEGFFVVKVGNDTQYTRAGSFSMDRTQQLVDGTGGFLQGWMFDNDGSVQTTVTPRNIKLSDYSVIPATATKTVTVKGGLAASTEIGGTVETMTKIVDGLGTQNDIKLRFTKTSASEWSLEGFDSTGVSLGTSTFGFSDVDGALVWPTAPVMHLNPPTSGAQEFDFTIDLGTAATGLHHYGTTSSLALEQDGHEKGELRDFGISEAGIITGRYSNGQLKNIAQIAMAHFANNEGLIKTGELHYRQSAVSGEPVIGVAGQDATGTIKAGVLEMSNVDLAREFTDLILAQRGFQANSRVITTSDEMIQELVNLKR